MFSRTAFLVAASVAAMSAVPAAASAEVLKFHVALDGKSGPEPTGSPATGSAKVRVDTVTHRVSVDLDVSGITIDDLWDKLVAAPVGPIHFHKYATAAGGDSVLALPLPYGPDYHAEKWGLKVRMKNYDYVAGAALVKSTLSFDDFVAGMKSGLIVLNVHTDQFNPGEISGLVVPG
jgi:methyl coenzyme M reductase alpha subunit